MPLRSFPLSLPVKLRAVAIQTCAQLPPPLPQIFLLAVLPLFAALLLFAVSFNHH